MVLRVQNGLTKDKFAVNDREVSCGTVAGGP